MGLVSLVFIVLLTGGGYAQTVQENREFDNILGMVPPQGFVPRLPPPGLEVITSSDGFDNFDIGVDFAEPHMSIHPTNPAWFFSAYNVISNYGATPHYTLNGHDWSSVNPVWGEYMRGDPVTAYDSLGNLYFENMYGSSSIQGCKVARSTDNGQTWLTPVTAIAGGDKNWIACDQTRGPYANYVYTTMTNISFNGGNFARSTDFGVTWTTTFTPSTQTLPGMMVCVGPNVLGGNNVPGGCVYVVTNSGSAFAATYTFYRSTDGGLTFAQRSSQSFANYVGTNVNGRNSVQNMRTRPYPFIAADNSYGSYRGRLYLVYASNSPAGDGNKPDIYCRYSTDQGATWSNAVTVNDDPNSQNNHQWHPSIWCDKATGRLYAKWLDTRNCPTSDSTDVYASYSDNGGTSFVPNQKLTTRLFRINCTTCNGGTPAYLGDYDAIASSQYGALTAWTDFRNGNFGSMVAYFPDFAMLMSPTLASIGQTDSTDVFVKIPAVKLYTQTAQFSAAVSPSGNVAVSFPQGNQLSTYPDSLRMRIKATGAATGTYTVTVTGSGPGGIPVHKRTVSVQVSGQTITVTQPNGGQTWHIGTSQAITWTSSGISGNVKIELSRNGGTNYSETLFASTLDDGSENWTVAGSVTSTARIKVTSISSPTVFDASNSNFSIVQPTITVTVPNGGGTWAIGSTQNIWWSSGGVSGNVKIELSRDGGSSYSTLVASTSNDGTEPWVVTSPPTSQARIKVSSVDNPAINDVSDANFSIVQPTITVTFPNGGETWRIGMSQAIQWTSTNLTGNVKIELSRNAGSTYETLFASTANDGSESWAVSGSTTAQARIRITSIDVPSLSDASDANFSIVQPTITVVVPNGGETWAVGANETIQWTSSNLTGSVKIELSRSGGSTYETLFTSTANDGTESWTVSSPVTSQARIRITSIDISTVNDASDANFWITQQSVTVMVPNGGEIWPVAVSRTIMWTSNLIAGGVKIELSRNGGSTFETLFDSTSNDGSEAWLVTGPVTSQALARISSVLNPGVVDISDAAFRISNQFVFLASLRVQDNAGVGVTLEFGTAAGATDGIDPEYGEEELPPVPPAGAFDARWQIAGTEGSLRDVREALGGSRTQAIYRCLMQPGTGGYPMTLRWSRSQFPAGLFVLRDEFAGSFFKVNMRLEDSVVIANSGLRTFQVVYSSPDTLEAPVDLLWNMVSLPMTVVDRRVTQVFPSATSSAYVYGLSGYVARDTLRYKEGYWLKFAAAETLSIAGSVRDVDTIDVRQGWNMIGSLSYAVSTAAVIELPGNLVNSMYFGYGPGGYVLTNVLQPMKGYWVKAREAGRLVLIGQ